MNFLFPYRNPDLQFSRSTVAFNKRTSNLHLPIKKNKMQNSELENILDINKKNPQKTHTKKKKIQPA